MKKHLKYFLWLSPLLLLVLYADDQEVEGSDFLKKLAAYGKDRAWLKKQSKKVAEQYILDTWFKNGSSRYSMKNLGNMKIQYNELLEEK